jgi:hypothetical protein
MTFFAWAQKRVRKWSVRKNSANRENPHTKVSTNDKPRIPGVTVKSEVFEDKNQFILGNSTLKNIFII